VLIDLRERPQIGRLPWRDHTARRQRYIVFCQIEYLGKPQAR
jgi:hypothetical protein